MTVFFDTNILVYLFDNDAPAKRERARALFQRHTQEGSLLISTQVLQELYVTLTRKLAVPLPEPDAREVIASLAELPVTQNDASTVMAAIDLSQRRQLSFWDALIIEAARRGGANVLLSEDLQHGQDIEGVRVENPFLN
jgi:predicted nucleic acid-binding protein